jgi:hypothetical protein
MNTSEHHGLGRMAAAAALAVAAALPAHAANLRAYAGVVAGNAYGDAGGFACATSGPTIGNGWFSGLALPTEGFATCHLSGGIDDKTGASGPLLATQAGSGAMVGGIGTYSGTAKARADYWSTGVAVSGLATGGSSTFTYRQSAAFASFTDTLTLSKAGMAAGTAGAVDFGFLIEGVMNSASNAPYTQQSDVALGIRVNGLYIWDSFAATLTNQGPAYLRGGSTGLPGAFVSGSGSLSGSALVTSTAAFNIQWDVPFTVEVALRASTSPCCYGTSASADFFNSAVLKGITAYGPSGRIEDFEVLAESGALLGPDGLQQPVPEPATAALLLLGLLGTAAWQRRR